MQTGYWQIKRDTRDQYNTSFATHRGLFEFWVMPMVLSNSSASFQRLIENVLGNLNWKKCLCYLDDIIIFGAYFDTTLENLRLIFERLKVANLKLKANKCFLFQTKIKYLGHVVSEEGVECDADTIGDARDWPEPKSKTELKSDLGFCGYFRKFIENCSEIAASLNKLTQKKAKFVWNQNYQTAFYSLKEALIMAPVLKLPATHDQFALDTDASGLGVDAVLSQLQNGTEHLIVYSS